MIFSDEFVTVEDIAGWLKVSRNTVEAMVSDGRLPAPMRLTPRTRRWKKSDVEKALGVSAPKPEPQGKARLRMEDLKWS